MGVSAKSRILFLILFLMVSPIRSQEDIFSHIRNKVGIDDIELYLEKFPHTLHQPSKEGFTPLILAAYTNNVELVKLFIKRGVDVNYNSSMGTALMAAIVKGNEDITKILLNQSIAIDLTDDKGTTALMYAVQFKNKNLIKLLLEFNPDRNITDNNGKTAFEYAVFSGDDEIINLLK